MQNLPDTTQGWLAQVGTLIGVGGLGALLIKLVERVFARADKRDDDARDYRRELRDEIRELNTRCDVLTARLDEARQRENALFARCAELEGENRSLRSRYHRLLNYVTTLIGAIDLDRRERGLSPLTSVPSWIDETIPGPTSGLPPGPAGEE